MCPKKLYHHYQYHYYYYYYYYYYCYGYYYYKSLFSSFVPTFRRACFEISLSINERRLERSLGKDRTQFSLADGVTAQLHVCILIEHALTTNDSARYMRTLLKMNLTNVSSKVENLKSKSAQIHGVEKRSLKKKKYDKPEGDQICWCAGFISQNFQKAEGTLPRKRLRSKVNVFSRTGVIQSILCSSISGKVGCINTFWNTTS